MAFIFVCGSHTFSSLLKGYEHVTCQCQNCGNFSARVYKRWQWFTICWVPVIPFSLKPWHEVGCHICNFSQDIKFRPDVQSQMNGGGGGGGQHHQQQQQQQQIPMQNYGGGQGQQGQQGQQQQGYQQGGEAGGKPAQYA